MCVVGLSRWGRGRALAFSGGFIRASITDGLQAIISVTNLGAEVWVLWAHGGLVHVRRTCMGYRNRRPHTSYSPCTDWVGEVAVAWCAWYGIYTINSQGVNRGVNIVFKTCRAATYLWSSRGLGEEVWARTSQWCCHHALAPSRRRSPARKNVDDAILVVVFFANGHARKRWRQHAFIGPSQKKVSHAR